MDPAPGGGSAAAFTGGLGCALGSMVSHILLSRSGLSAKTRGGLRRQAQALDQLTRRFEFLVAEDARAYDGLVRACKSRAGVNSAKNRALQSPLAMCEAAVEAGQILHKLRPLAGNYLGSDLQAGRGLLKGAFEAAAQMVEVNLMGDRNSKSSKLIRQRVDVLRHKMPVK